MFLLHRIQIELPGNLDISQWPTLYELVSFQPWDPPGARALSSRVTALTSNEWMTSRIMIVLYY
jgi:hypothetical protein